jgi:PIN domain nuclease of toxin-antitoxin system
VKALLDTHVLVWANERPAELGATTRALLTSPTTELFVASVSTLEIARLAAIRQLQLKLPTAQWCRRAAEALRATSLDMSDAVAVEAYALPGKFHRDPADRILVATARVFGITLVTADQRILKYQGVRTQNARR